MTHPDSWVISPVTPNALWSETSPSPNLTPALLGRWEKTLKEWEAPEAVHRNLSQLAAGACRVIVTGQQPGFWGGPLYSFYKAATAIALAERVAQKTGTPTIPVFWVQGDDTDWDEVGWGTLPKPDLSLVRHRWNPGPVPGRHWIGSARVEPVPAMTEVSTQWRMDARTPFLDIDPAHDLADTFARGLLAFFGHRGLVPLDSRWPEIRGAGKKLWERYIPRHEEFSREVLEAGDRLAKAGQPGSIDTGASEYGLFLLDGEHRLPPDPETWESRARDLAANRPQDLAPSVLLRGILQDHLLGTSAHVVGRSEGAYLRQLEPVYQGMEVSAPLRLPRLQATVVPPGMLPATGLESILTDPEQWVRDRLAAALPVPSAEALASLKGAVSEHLAALADSEGDLREAAEQTRRKMDSQIERLQETALRQGRKQLYRKEPLLRNISEFLRPRRGPQERGLSGASLAFFFGNDAPEVILKAAHRHLDCLNNGELHHFKLEATRE